MSPRAHASRQDGFTIIEVMVAAMLLLVGMLGLLSMVDRADQATASNRAREAATNLAREVVEQARAVQYNQITQAGLAAKIQAEAPGLASTSGGGAWTVRRRNFTFTISTSVCAIDDPRDGLGDHSAGGFCAGPSGTDDGGPQDFKQVSATVSWTAGGATKSVKSTSLITTHGTSDVAVTRNLVATGTSPVTTIADPARPLLTSTSVTSITFEAEASSSATRVIWSVDGVDKGNATKVGSKWQFTLTIPASTTAMTDGDYEIGTRAVDTLGAEGPTLSIPLRLLRTVPSAPTNLVIGNNRVRDGGVLKDAVELEWHLNPERNVRGYRVYRGDNSLACPTDPTAIDKRPSCIDVSPSYGTYKVRALYENASGVIVESPNVATATVSAPNWDALTLYLHGPQITSGYPSGCASNGSVFPMSSGYAGGTPISGGIGGNAVRFCANVTEPASRTLYGGEFRVEMWARNTSTTSTCSLSALMGYNGDAAKSVTGTGSVPPGFNGLLTFAKSYTNMAVAAGDRPVAQFNVNGSPSQCSATTFTFGGTDSRSLFYSPAPNELPKAPTGLTGTPTAEGLKLTWTAPAAAGTDWFYRIYRVGTDYTQRYDRTPGSSTTFTVPDSNGAQQYWVTAVNPRLAESPVSNSVVG